MKKLVDKIMIFINRFRKFPGSASYWEKRYETGGTSGSGSYKRLAEFKAEVVNNFVKEKNIKSIVELGCGDGNQLLLAQYPNYTGLDVSETIIKKCKRLFKHDPTKNFFLYNSVKIDYEKLEKEASISLDVIFHLVEDDIFDDYMNDLFHLANKYVIIYSSNFDTIQAYHERDRKFTEWVKQHQKEWNLIKTIKNKYPFNPENPDNTSKCDFFIYEKN